jgi:uncharacterized protein with von Willebrand factor type A (vWA) domain
MTQFGVQTLVLDLPAVSAQFGRRLWEAGVPVTPERSARFATALSLVRPVARRRLYFTARAVFVSDPSQLRSFNRVFAEVFGGAVADGADPTADVRAASEPPPETAEATDGVSAPGESGELQFTSDSRNQIAPEAADEVPVPMLASSEELLRAKRFDTLSPDELAELYRLMARMRIEAPLRRMRRARRDLHGDRIDLRRTLRDSMHTAGDPIRLARRRRRVVRRRVVLLCDISGSMEPYARAYLRFLTSAAGAGPNAEAFVFATQLTRLTRALASRNPERAIQRAAAVAPDWSSGTRIGEALKQFTDRHGRRGMARGAVIVIMSDGWEREDPALVGREMQRLRRLAYRIVWVNPRAAVDGFAPRAGGMAAALPHCDALISGHNLDALERVVEEIAVRRAGGVTARSEAPEPPEVPEAQEEAWGSATPVAGSSVAMPSGYGPSRGKTTPGWSIG